VHALTPRDKSDCVSFTYHSYQSATVNTALHPRSLSLSLCLCLIRYSVVSQDTVEKARYGLFTIVQLDRLLITLHRQPRFRVTRHVTVKSVGTRIIKLTYLLTYNGDKSEAELRRGKCVLDRKITVKLLLLTVCEERSK